MKPSSRRMRAISSFVRLVGMLTVSWRAPAALRTRVSMSATGSFGIPMPFGRAFLGGVAGLRAGRSVRGSPGCSPMPLICSSVNTLTSTCLPARLRDARQLADQRTLAEADPAEAEDPHIPARPTADLTAVVRPSLELGRPPRLQDEALLRHRIPLRTQYGTASRGRAATRVPLRPFSPS